MNMLEDLNVGDAIPPERVLAEECQVARLTVRRAVDDLVNESYLVRRQGSGTYVVRPTLRQSPDAASFSVDMRRRGLTPVSQILSVDWMDAGTQISWRLNVAPSDRVLRIRRLRLADDEPMAVATTHLPETLVPGLHVDKLEQHSLYRVLEGQYGLRVSTGTQAVLPAVTEPEEARLLRVPPYSPAFLFRTTTSTADGTVVEFTATLFRGDRYILSSDLDLRHLPEEDVADLSGLRAIEPYD